MDSQHLLRITLVFLIGVVAGLALVATPATADSGEDITVDNLDVSEDFVGIVEDEGIVEVSADSIEANGETVDDTVVKVTIDDVIVATPTVEDGSFETTVDPTQLDDVDPQQDATVDIHGVDVDDPPTVDLVHEVLTLDEGFNPVSVPQPSVLYEDDTQAFFQWSAEDQRWQSFSFDAGEETIAATDDLHSGLYIDANEDARLGFEYVDDPGLPSPGEVELQEGWNFIGTNHDLSDQKTITVTEDSGIDAAVLNDIDLRDSDFNEIDPSEELGNYGTYWINIDAEDEVERENVLQTIYDQSERVALLADPLNEFDVNDEIEIKQGDSLEIEFDNAVSEADNTFDGFAAVEVDDTTRIVEFDDGDATITAFSGSTTADEAAGDVDVDVTAIDTETTETISVTINQRLASFDIDSETVTRGEDSLTVDIADPEDTVGDLYDTDQEFTVTFDLSELETLADESISPSIPEDITFDGSEQISVEILDSDDVGSLAVQDATHIEAEITDDEHVFGETINTELDVTVESEIDTETLKFGEDIIITQDEPLSATINGNDLVDVPFSGEADVVVNVDNLDGIGADEVEISNVDFADGTATDVAILNNEETDSLGAQTNEITLVDSSDSADVTVEQALDSFDIEDETIAQQDSLDFAVTNADDLAGEGFTQEINITLNTEELDGFADSTTALVNFADDGDATIDAVLNADETETLAAQDTTLTATATEFVAGDTTTTDFTVAVEQTLNESTVAFDTEDLPEIDDEPTVAITNADPLVVDLTDAEDFAGDSFTSTAPVNINVDEEIREGPTDHVAASANFDDGDALDVEILNAGTTADGDGEIELVESDDTLAVIIDTTDPTAEIVEINPEIYTDDNNELTITYSTESGEAQLANAVLNIENPDSNTVVSDDSVELAATNAEIAFEESDLQDTDGDLVQSASVNDYDVTLTVIDNAGNENTAVDSFTVDNTVDVEPDGPGDGEATNNNKQPIEFKIDTGVADLDEDATTVSVINVEDGVTFLDEVAVSNDEFGNAIGWDGDAALNVDITELDEELFADGNISATVDARDTNGNTDSSTQEFVVDTDDPGVELNSPDGSTDDNRELIVFDIAPGPSGLDTSTTTATVNENPDSTLVDAAIDENNGLTWDSDTQQLEIDISASDIDFTFREGDIDAAVNAHDQAGNDGSGDNSFTVDLTEPEAIVDETAPSDNGDWVTDGESIEITYSVTNTDNIGPSGYADGQPVLNITNPDGAVVNSQELEDLGDEIVTELEFTDLENATGTVVDGNYTVELIAEDNAGNFDSGTNSFDVDGTLDVDATEPGDDQTTKDNEQTIEFEVETGETDLDEDATTVSVTNVEGGDDGVTFLGEVAVSNNEFGDAIEIESDDENEVEVLSIDVTDAAINTQAGDGNIFADGKIKATVNAQDEAGNEEEVDQTFTVDTTVEAEPDSPGDEVATNDNQQTVNFSISTGIDSGAVINIDEGDITASLNQDDFFLDGTKVNENDGLEFEFDDETGEHTLTINITDADIDTDANGGDIFPDGSITASVNAEDASGFEDSAEQTFTVDTDEPEATINEIEPELVADDETVDITYSVTNTDNIGPSGYADGQPVLNITNPDGAVVNSQELEDLGDEIVTELEFTDLENATGTVVDGEYTVELIAEDNAGNSDSETDIFTVDTVLEVDADSPGTDEATDDRREVITFDITTGETDLSTTETTVTVEDSAGLVIEDESVADNDGLTWDSDEEQLEVDITADNIDQTFREGEVEATVDAQDEAGNEEEGDQTFTVDLSDVTVSASSPEEGASVTNTEKKITFDVTNNGPAAITNDDISVDLEDDDGIIYDERNANQNGVTYDDDSQEIKITVADTGDSFAVGEVTAEVEVSDQAGNEDDAALTFEIEENED